MSHRQLDKRYLLGPDRLADVLAGIQFIGTYRKYKVSLADWQDRIKRPPLSAETGEDVFNAHHEFFRVSRGEVCLILRRGRPSNYHNKLLKTLTREEKEVLSDRDRNERITREPLNVDEIGVLMNTAIEMHARAMSHKEDQRRYTTIWVTLLAIFVSIVVALIRVEAFSDLFS